MDDAECPNADSKPTEACNLASLPDGVLTRIVQATDPESRRQLRLASRALRLLVDACTATLTLSSYSIPCLTSRGHLPTYAPELRSIILSLQDTTAPAGFLEQLPSLGLAQLPRLTSLTLLLANDHVLSRAAITDFAASIPPSTTRLVLTHMLGCGDPSPPAAPVTRAPVRNLTGTAANGRSDAAAASASSSQLDLVALHHLLLLCPQLREVRLDGCCWIRGLEDLKALADLAGLHQGGSTGASGASDGGGDVVGVVVGSLRVLYFAAANSYQELPRTLASLSGLKELDVQLVAATVQHHPGVGGGGGGGFLAEAAAAVDLAHLALASEQLRRALSGPALAGLTRLVLCEFPGSTVALLSALQGLPLLSHVGLSGLDDARYITETHLELLARLPSLRHLAVDRLDLSQPLTTCSFAGASRDGALLPGLTGLEVALVAHSVPRLPHVFPAVAHLTLRWLWEQAMRKLAGWTSLSSLSLAHLDGCLDWGLLRTLTGLTQLRLCQGSSYEQLAELLYLLRALPGLQVLRLVGWHCMRNSDSGRMALGVTRGLGLGPRAGSGAGDGPCDGGTGPPSTAAGEQLAARVAEIMVTAAADAGAASEAGQQPSRVSPTPQSARSGGVGVGGDSGAATSSHTASSGCRSPSSYPGAGTDPHSPPLPSATTTSTSASASSTTVTAMAAAMAAMDPDLHRAWTRIRAAPDAASAAGAAVSLLRALPSLHSLELSDCGAPLLRCLASRAVVEDGGPLRAVRELRLMRMLDVIGEDVEEAVAALPGLSRLVVQGCWPVDGESLLRLASLRERGVDVMWRR